MRVDKLIMGMPARVELVGTNDKTKLERVFSLWNDIEERFSTYKTESEISRINRGEIDRKEVSRQMQEVFSLAETVRGETDGYFDIKRPDGAIDPSGLVKGWAIQKAAELLDKNGLDSYYLEIGGDIQTRGHDEEGKLWTIGIRNPFDRTQIVKVLYPKGAGVATSGTAARGEHIYNPHAPSTAPSELASITVTGPNVYEADCFATAAFAMGKKGVHFLNARPGFEAYAIDRQGIATMTDGIDTYLTP